MEYVLLSLIVGVYFNLIFFKPSKNDFDELNQKLDELLDKFKTK